VLDFNCKSALAKSKTCKARIANPHQLADLIIATLKEAVYKADLILSMFGD